MSCLGWNPRDAAGLDPVLDLHCLRHSFITHLIEFGYPERFAQDQAGHSYASTTAIYTKSRKLHQTGEKLQVA
jgi:site-specific recombinase XerD